MDLNTITAVAHPTTRDQLPVWTAGDAWLAGGTWLFSEPQVHLSRLIDLTALKWPALTVTETELSISATCTVAQLDALACPPEWIASPLINQCCSRVPRLLQDMEDGDRRRQHLHVAAGGADDLAHLGARRHLHDLAGRRRRAENCGRRFRHRRPAQRTRAGRSVAAGRYPARGLEAAFGVPPDFADAGRPLGGAA